MNKIGSDGVEDKAQSKNRLLELVEMLVGIGAIALMAYFYYSKGYVLLIKQIWGSLFG